MDNRLNAAFAIVALAAAHGPAAAQHRPGAATSAATIRTETVRPASDENLQWAASVVQISALRRQGDLGGKLFGAAGGDPAMNGLNTYLAFYQSPAEGWRIFRIGDFLTYRILAETRGHLTLEVSESVMNARTGNIGSRVRRLQIGWTAGRGGTPPASINVTAAR